MDRYGNSSIGVGYTLKYRDSSRTSPPVRHLHSTYNSTNNALTNLFHNYGRFKNYNNRRGPTRELSGLDDFRRSPLRRSNMAAIYEYWSKRLASMVFASIHQACGHGFWQSWCPAVHALCCHKRLAELLHVLVKFTARRGSLRLYTGTQAAARF